MGGEKVSGEVEKEGGRGGERRRNRERKTRREYFEMHTRGD